MEDILEVLKTGMEIELNGITLYKSASERTDDPKAKEVFNFLSQEEVKHYGYLKKAYDAASSGEKINIEISLPETSFNRIFSDDFLKNLKGKNFEFSAISTGMILEKILFCFIQNKPRKQPIQT